jgi:hypothetical protein
MYKLKKEVKQRIMDDSSLILKIQASFDSAGKSYKFITVREWFRQVKEKSRTKEVIDIVTKHYGINENDLFEMPELENAH